MNDFRWMGTGCDGTLKIVDFLRNGHVSERGRSFRNEMACNDCVLYAANLVLSHIKNEYRIKGLLNQFTGTYVCTLYDTSPVHLLCNPTVLLASRRYFPQGCCGQLSG